MSTKLVEKKDGLYLDDGHEQHKVIRGFEYYTGWYWYAISQEVIPAADSITDKDEIVFYGYVQGDFPEWGSFPMCELAPLIKKGLVWELKGGDLLCSGRR